MKHTPPVYEPGQIWQDKKNKQRYIRLTFVGENSLDHVDVDTGKIGGALRADFSKKFKLCPEKSGGHLVDTGRPPVAVGQSYHLHDDLTDTMRIVGRGETPGTWMALDSNSKFVIHEDVIRDKWVLIVDPLPAPVGHRDTKPANGDSKGELLDLQMTIAMHVITTDQVERLNVEKSKLVCACGDSNEAKDLSFPEYLKSVARFYLRHEPCFRTNVLPGLHEDRIDPKVHA